MKRSVYNLSVVKPENKRPHGSHKRRWEDNIKIYLQGVVLLGIDWIDMAQDRGSWQAHVNTLMNIRVL